ncbi:GNAT family N-acetyltransferase [Amycolatopsis sp. OK19-0408]|uniref:GNAT family N-acetyltransferase n=1 Tax=Amycolatopsis iheyensis TaxID=2945988 RepID=A0A9X2N7T4_9PSEU|nr:GNAT family N-acetyltransferase [Amycolatopsis iheyensis]MCR6482091.1 GNAT family N-acetyltransferase [Amycolatopsis iheyensis]
MPKIEVRPAHPAELATVAALRWRWVVEQDGPPEGGRAGFVREFAAWARANEATHRCLVLARDDEVIGMAFLAITSRVPTPRVFARASGDVQSVYVLPEARDGGLGGLLIDATLRLAEELGLERVTVHSSERAVPAYERRGFAVSPQLLQTGVSGLSPARRRSSSASPRPPAGGAG